MIKMSFYDGTLDRNKALELIQDTEKVIKYTYGLGYRNPTTYKKPITKLQAIKTINCNGMIDITEYDDWIHINEFSDNDMW